MAPYLSARGIVWDSRRYHASWVQFENHVISADGIPVGTLRLLEVDGALEIRDLQVLPSHHGQGIGKWAIDQAKIQAAERGMAALRLRVFPDNPAQRLYSRHGFQVVATDNGVVHMVHALPPDNSSRPKPLVGSA
ncbi:MAG: GNAT family N-acetyltransferase [Gammaproteobacteria bacterium]|nr:GNAT family N-acetyltransferase [Gammaproteobacteria bacterium]